MILSSFCLRGKESNNVGLQVIAAALHVGWQCLRVLLRVFKLHLKHVEYVVGHRDEEGQDFLLSRPEQSAIARVKC